MNLKKLSVATALSIGIMTIGGIAKADTGAACPICPPAQVQCPEPCAPCCPTGYACPAPVATQVLIPQNTCPTEVYAPVCPQPACPQNAMVSSCPIQTCLPNCAPNAHVFKRQSYAFPDIGSSSLVIPKGTQMVQIGGNDEAVAVNAANSCGGLAGLPNYGGALTLLPTSQTGAAAPLSPVCPVQITQGLEIMRCNIPGTTKVLQGAFNNPCFGGACNACSPCATGAAMPILVDPCNPCSPCGAACPVNPCDPCSPLYPAGFACPCDPCLPTYQTGAAAPLTPYAPCDPCNACVPCNPCNPCGAACPVSPCDACNPCATGFAVPYNPCSPCQPCNPCGVTGFAANQGLFPYIEGQTRSIQTSSGLQIQRTVLMPVAVPTGAACPAGEHFPDVSNCATSGCDVNKLASKGILVGYPEGNYKPSMPIERDEFASALVSALELQNVPDFKQQIFNDVPLHHWANADIDKVYNRGLMAGLPNCMFNPDGHITRAEVLSIMAKAIPGEMSACDAQNILSQYCDSNKIMADSNNVAEALASGLIKQLPDCNCIKPNNEASRGEVASMLENLRVKLALEACPCPTGAACPTAACPTGELQPQIVASTIPTLKMKFEDIISARTSEVGDRFVAKTTEAVNIDGILYPAGAEVRGKVAEVIRPGLGQSGAIRVDFHSIGFNGAAKTTLPREILSATVIQEDNPNIVGRFLAWPFSWPGKLAGIAGRTAGGAAIIAGNMTEGILTNFGNGTNELFNAKFRAAGRSYLMSLQDLGMGIFDTGRLAVSGTVGIVKETGDELAYVVKPDGSRIAQINPNEVLSVAFPIQ